MRGSIVTGAACAPSSLVPTRSKSPVIPDAAGGGTTGTAGGVSRRGRTREGSGGFTVGIGGGVWFSRDLAGGIGGGVFTPGAGRGGGTAPRMVRGDAEGGAGVRGWFVTPTSVSGTVDDAAAAAGDGAPTPGGTGIGGGARPGTVVIGWIGMSRSVGTG
ncbi:MAG: hypothetical protein KIT31_02880 [Deltaproteobacteria bacterium]|nr:hypothetical protein [Deltaproteobacteria bacterium]